MEVSVAAPFDQLTDRGAAFGAQKIAQQHEALIQTELIHRAAKQVQLSLELRRQRFPVLIEEAADVVALPTFQRGLIEVSGLPVKERHWTTVRTARAPDPFERRELAAIFSEDRFLPGELLDGCQPTAAFSAHQLLRAAVRFA